MKKKANIELSESEVKQIIAEYFGVQDKNDISFDVVEGQMRQEIVTCRIWKEIEFPEKVKTITLESRPNWWPEGVREPIDTSKGSPDSIPIPLLDPLFPHDPFKPSVTWSDRTETTYTAADTKGENK